MLTERQEKQIGEYLDKKRNKANTKIHILQEIEYGYMPKELQPGAEQEMQESMVAFFAALEVAKLAGVGVELGIKGQGMFSLVYKNG